MELIQKVIVHLEVNTILRTLGVVSLIRLVRIMALVVVEVVDKIINIITTTIITTITSGTITVSLNRFCKLEQDLEISKLSSY